MKTFSLYCLYTLLIMISANTIARDHEEHAYHKYIRHTFLYDNIVKDDDSDHGTVTYNVAIKGIPSDSVIDQIYLRIKFDEDVDRILDRFIMVENTCKNSNFTVGRDKFLTHVDAQFLELSYGFTDTDHEIILSDPNCWQFTIESDETSFGGHPVNDVEMMVTYHQYGTDAMPALYSRDPYISYADIPKSKENFTGENTLHGIALDDILNETTNKEISDGYRIPDGTKKIIVLLHGWNRESKENHYAHPEKPITQVDVDHDREDAEMSWIHMMANISTFPSVRANNWVVSRYDYAKDADTGGILVSSSYNAARDAAFIHGKKLGQILLSLNERDQLSKASPLKVQFVADSAGAWVARRAVEYLNNRLKDKVELQVTLLDPFINDYDTGLPFDLNTEPDFTIVSELINRSENYFTLDFETDVVSWTSNWLNGWDINQDIEGRGTHYQLCSKDLHDYTFIKCITRTNEKRYDHGDPRRWYALTAKKYNSKLVAVGSIVEGFATSMAFGWESDVVTAEVLDKSLAQNQSIEIQYSRHINPDQLIDENGECTSLVKVTGDKTYSLICQYHTQKSVLEISTPGGFTAGQTLLLTINDAAIDFYNGESVSGEVFAILSVSDYSTSISFDIHDVIYTNNTLIGYIRASDKRYYGGAVTVEVNGSLYSANVVQVDDLAYFSIPIARLSKPEIAISYLIEDGYEANITTDIEYRDGGFYNATSLSFNKVSYTQQGSSHFQIRGFVRNDLGEGVEGEVRFSLADKEYSDDLYIGQCGSSSTIDYCNGSFFVINAIPLPYLNTLIELSATTPDASLVARHKMPIPGVSGEDAGDANITFFSPSASTRWRIGTEHFINYRAQGIDITDKLRFRLIRLADGAVFKIGTDSADDSTTDWRIDGALPAGNYQIQVFRDSSPETSWSSSVFALLSENDKPVARDLSMLAISGKSTSANITAWDPNQDALIYELGSQAPSNGSLSVSGSTFTYLSDVGFEGRDRFTIRISDGDLSTEVTVQAFVFPKAKFEAYEIIGKIETNQLSPVTYLRKNGEAIYAANEDGRIIKYDLEGQKVDALETGDDIHGMDVNNNKLVIVDDSSDPSLAVYNAENFNLAWRQENIAADNATGLVLGEDKIFITFEKKATAPIMAFSLLDQSQGQGYSLDDKDYHDGKDINSLAFKRIPRVGVDDTVLVTVGDNEELLAWNEDEPFSFQGYKYDQAKWNEDIVDVAILGSDVFAGGENGSIAKFSLEANFKRQWSTENIYTDDVRGMHQLGSELITIGSDHQMKVLDPDTGEVTETLTLPNESRSLLVFGNKIYIGLENGEIVIVARNTPPILESKTLETEENTTLSFPASIIDPDISDRHTLIVDQHPAHGELSIIDNEQIRYVPGQDYIGSDTFAVSVSDQKITTTSNFEIDITPIPPEAIVEVENKQSILTVGNPIALMASDPLNSLTQFEWAVTVKPDASEVEHSAQTSQTFAFTPDIRGAYTVSLRVFDGVSWSETTDFRVSVLNHAPTIETVAFDILGGIDSSVLLVVTDEDQEDVHEIEIVENLKKGQAFFNDTGSLTIRPTQSLYGQDSLVVKVTDSKGSSTQSEITLTIENASPLAFDQSIDVPRGNAIRGRLNGIDANSDSLHYVILTQPSSGELTLLDSANGSFLYKAGTNIDQETIEFKVTDGVNESNTASLTINVLPALPNIVNLSAIFLSADTLTLSTDIESNNLPGEVYFELGSDKDTFFYKSENVAFSPTDETAKVEMEFVELDCNKTYYVKIHAENTDGEISTDAFKVESSGCPREKKLNTLGNISISNNSLNLDRFDGGSGEQIILDFTINTPLANYYVSAMEFRHNLDEVIESDLSLMKYYYDENDDGKIEEIEFLGEVRLIKDEDHLSLVFDRPLYLARPLNRILLTYEF